MITYRFLAPAALALGLASCASKSEDVYDTSNPYGTPDGGAQASQAVAPVNPVYDTPAAYEESTTAPTSPEATIPAAPTRPTITPRPSAAKTLPAAARPIAAAGATSHTVVKGDSLWGLSKKYHVSVDAIKQANAMTKDTVILGQKLVIPAP